MTQATTKLMFILYIVFINGVKRKADGLLLWKKIRPFLTSYIFKNVDNCILLVLIASVVTGWNIHASC